MLTKTRVAEVFTYEDGKLFRNGKRTGCIAPSGVRHTFLDGKIYLEHRVVYLLCKGTLPKYLDHINGNPSDNRIANLRACTLRQNSANSKTPKSNTSGVKGVCRTKEGDKWRARLSVKGKEMVVGNYFTIEEAAAALAVARVKYHKEFANNGGGCHFV